VLGGGDSCIQWKNVVPGLVPTVYRDLLVFWIVLVPRVAAIRGGDPLECEVEAGSRKLEGLRTLVASAWRRKGYCARGRRTFKGVANVSVSCSPDSTRTSRNFSLGAGVASNGTGRV